MLTEFGKILRKIRIDNCELLKDMADKLSVTPSYLSAVETGKRNVPEDWPDQLFKLYSLDIKDKDLLEEAAYNSKLQLKLNLDKLNNKDKNLALSFAREFQELTTIDKDRILEILSKRKRN
ncbi:UNVERIFIED_CONTAM: hypothetical protein Cloal_1221 [Acetivibrio alkalicellulosi]